MTGIRHRKRVVRGTVIGIATVAVAAVATGTFGPATPRAAAAGLTAFDDCQAVDDWYTDALLPKVGPWGLPFTGYGVGPMFAAASGAPAMAREAAGAPAAADTATGAGSQPVGNGETGTNVQERGVDEPDVAKTADGIMVTTVGNDLVVLDVTGAAAVTLGSVTIVEGTESQQSGWAMGLGSAQLLLDGDRVVAIRDAGWYPMATMERTAGPATSPGFNGSPPGFSGPSTVVTVIDIADRTTPRIVSSSEITGSLVDARQHGGSVRIVTTSTPTIAFPTPTDDFVDDQGNPEPAEEAKATAANREALQAMTGEDFLPQLLTRAADGTVSSRPAFGCAALAHPGDFAGAGVITVSTLLPGEASPGTDPVTDRVAVSADGSMVYASTDRLYVATTFGGWSGGWLPQPPAQTTDLHGFDLSAPGTARYLASGSVDGWVIGPWAMSAVDGYLRVATTRDHSVVSPDGSVQAVAPAGAVAASSAPAVVADPGVAVEPDSPGAAAVPGSTGTAVPGNTGTAVPGNTGTAEPGGVPDVPPATGGAVPVEPPIVEPDPIATSEPEPAPLPSDVLPPDPMPAPDTDSAVTILKESGDTLTPVGQVDGLGKGERIQAVRWMGDTAYVVTFRQTDPLYVVDLTDPTAPRVTGELKVPGFSSYLHPVGEHRLLGVGSAANDTGRITGSQVSVFDVADPAAPVQVDVLTRPDSYLNSNSRSFSYLPGARTAVVTGADYTKGSLVVSFRVGEDGKLTTAGAYSPSSDSYVAKVMPVDADTLVALTQTPTGVVATTLGLDLTETGSTAL